MGEFCSIVIRTRNEERWITPCLSAVYDQKHREFEVILIDNESTDLTMEKARQFPVDKIVTCADYRPGKALNMGIKASKGDYIVCLSGHCIPVNDVWLTNLVRNLGDPLVAAAYGRQEPVAFSTDADKRDLLLIFGLDRRVQVKDSFFHNANSVIRRDLWEQVPFDEETTNIEDRIWAQKVLQLGYRIIYDPEARVYHHHGIHQNGDVGRCASVVRILEALQEEPNAGAIDAHKLNIVAFIPVKGPGRELAGRPAMAYTVEHALASRYIKRVIVSTDDEDMAKKALTLGAEVPFLRPPSLSKGYVSLEAVWQYSLGKIEEMVVYPDLVVSLEVTFPFRPEGLIDDIIERTVTSGLDTVIAARAESRSLWREAEDGTVNRLDSGYVPRQFKERAFIGLKGICCVTHPEFLRQGRLLGDKIGLYEVNSPYASIEVREDEDFRLAEQIMKVWSA